MAGETESNQVPAPIGSSVAPADAPAASGVSNQPSPGAPKSGLSRHLQKAWRALERAGYAIGGAASAPAADPDGDDEPAETIYDAPRGEPQMVAGPSFDEAATRVGVTGIVDTADALAAQFVGASAADVLDEKDAARFAAKVRMTPAVHDGMISAGVEVCRAENVNLPPHATLATLAGGWLYGVFSVVKELKALKASGKSTPPPAP